MIVATTLLKITHILDKVSKHSINYKLVRGTAGPTFISAMFFGEYDQTWIGQYKAGDIIRVTGRLTARAYMSQKTPNKQFVNINITVDSFELVCTAEQERLTNINKIANALRPPRSKDQEPTQEVEDDSPF